METIQKSDCQKIGFIRKTHGVQGELVLEYEYEFEDSVAQANRFFLEVDGLLVPFFVAEDGLRFKSAKTVLVQFNWIEDEIKARRFVGCPVYLFLHEIIEGNTEGSAHHLMNYRLLDEKLNEIGIIAAVDDFSGNIVFTLDANGREILVPYNDDLLLEINDELKTIKLQLPDGLLE